MDRKQKFPLGITVKDKITGFSGIITGLARYITGCDQYLVQPEAKNGDYKEGRWFDEGRLVEVPEKSRITEDQVESVGDGACDPPPIK